MKHIFTYLLTLSVGVNIYFIVKKLEYNKKNEEKRALYFWKEISHKEGYAFYKNKMKADFKETYSGQKTALICFWDSTSYDFIQRRTMEIFDSLATEFGQHTFDYVFATEMDEASAKAFLKRKGVEFRNFTILGGMDDFISGVYNERPVKWMPLSRGEKKDTIKPNPKCPDPKTMKVRPYYLLMDNKGGILYHNYKWWRPYADTALMRRLNSYSTTRSLKKTDY